MASVGPSQTSCVLGQVNPPPQRFAWGRGTFAPRDGGRGDVRRRTPTTTAALRYAAVPRPPAAKRLGEDAAASYGPCVSPPASSPKRFARTGTIAPRDGGRGDVCGQHPCAHPQF